MSDETVLQAAIRVQSAVSGLTLGDVLDSTLVIGLGAAAQMGMTLEDVVKYLSDWYPEFVEQWARKQAAHK